MFWIAFYGVLAVAFAVTTFLAAEWIREHGAPAPDYPGLLAIVTGLLWPVVVTGAAQFGLIIGLQSLVQHAHRQPVVVR